MWSGRANPELSIRKLEERVGRLDVLVSEVEAQHFVADNLNVTSKVSPHMANMCMAACWAQAP